MFSAAPTQPFGTFTINFPQTKNSIGMETSFFFQNKVPIPEHIVLYHQINDLIENIVEETYS